MASEGSELGVEYVSILPSMVKFAGQLTKGVTSASTSAAKSFTAQFRKDVTKGAETAGKEAGAAMARAALAAAKSDVAKLGKSLAAATDKQADSLGKLRVAESKLTDAREKAASTARRMQDAEEKLAALWEAEVADTKAIEAAERELERARSSAASATTRLTSAEESAASAKRKANSATDAATAASEKLTKAQQKEKEAADAVGKAQEDAGKKASLGARLGSKFSDSFKQGFNPSKAVGDELGRVDGSKPGRDVGGRFGNAFTGSFKGLATKAIATIAASVATIGIGNFVKSSVDLEASFSQTMNTMAAAAKVPAAGMKELNDLAIDLGAKTSFSAAQAATAMLELAKGGLSAATIQSGALAGTLTLAAAGGTSLESAATIASNALNTFQLKGKDMAAVAAALAGGANASTASVESLGEALGQVGPGARLAGLSLNDTVGVLAAFDNAGIKGSDAGTSLKTMLTRLVPTTKASAKAMKRLGLDFTDANGKFLPITQVAEQLRVKLSKLSDEQRTQALSTIFGSDATRAASVLMTQGAKGIGQYVKATQDQNAANEIAAARMSGTAGAVEQFKGAIETAKIQLGQFLAPAVQAGLGKLSDGISKIAPAAKGIVALLGKGDFTKDLREAFNIQEDSPIVGFLLNLRKTIISVFNEIKARVTPSIQAIGQGFQNLVPFVVSFATNLKNDLLPPATAVAKILVGLALLLVQSVGPAFQAVTGFIKDHATLIQAIVVGVGAAVLAFKAYQGALLVAQAVGKAFAVVQAIINAVMSANVIAIVVLAVVALVAALIYAYKHSDKFRAIVDAAFNGTKKVVLAVVGVLVGAFKAVVGAISAVIDFVKNHWKTILPLILGPIIGIPLFIALHWKQIKDAFMAGVSAVFGFLKAAWGAIVDVFAGPVNAVLGVLQAVWSRIYPIIALPFYIAKKFITDFWNNLVVLFSAAATWVSATFSKAWNKVYDVLSGPINAAKSWIADRWADIQTGFSVALTWVTTNFSKGWNAVKDVLTGPINAAKKWISNYLTDVKNGFIVIKDWVVKTWSKSWNAVKDAMIGPINTAKAAITTVLGAAKGGLQWAFRQAVTGIGKIWDGLKAAVKAPIKFAIDVVLNDGLIDGFNWVAKKFNAPTIEHIPLPKGFAEGGEFSGRLPGRPSAVDNMIGMSAAGPVGLATGEFITNAKDTARALPLLQHINSGGSLPGFADGGIFGKIKSGITGAFNAGKEFGSDAIGFLKDPVKWFKDRFAGPLGRLDELGNSTLAQTVKAVPKKAASTIIDGAKSLLGLGGGGGFNAGLTGVLQFVRSQVGKPYVWGGVGPAGYDCSGLVSAAINVALGRNPYSRLGATGSMPWGMMDPGLGAFSIGWFQGNPGHTAATVNGTNIESRGGRGVLMGHAARGATDGLFTNHAHLRGFAKGGLLGDPPFDLLSRRGKAFNPEALVFDNGGILPTGPSMVINKTGHPEPLGRDPLTADDLDGLRFVLDADGVGTLTGYIDGAADARIAKNTKDTKRRVYQGVRK